MSWLWAMGMMPARLISPTVGFTVTTPFWLAGDSSEPEVSVPMAAAASPAATATAEPALDPPGETRGMPFSVERGRIGIADLAAERGIAGRHVDREDVRELGEVGLAENDRAGIAQALRHRCVAHGLGIGERQRAGGGVLGIAGGDVVLQEDRDAFERPPLCRLCGVEPFRDGERLRIEFAHRIEARAGAIIGLDPRGIGTHEIGGRGLAGGERVLQFADARVLDTHRSLATGPSTASAGAAIASNSTRTRSIRPSLDRP